MGCDQTTMNDVSEAERERQNPSKNIRATSQPQPMSPSKIQPIQQRKTVGQEKKTEQSMSVTDRKDMDYNAFKNNILNKQGAPVKKTAYSEGTDKLLLEEQRVQAANQEQKNQEAKILARVRQEMFLLSLLAGQDDEEEREREIEEREIWYLNQKGWNNVHHGIELPKTLEKTKLPAESIQDHDMLQLTNQLAGAAITSLSKMKVNDVGSFITHFSK